MNYSFIIIVDSDSDVEMQQSCFGNDPSTSVVSESCETDVSQKDNPCLICNKSRVTVNKKDANPLRLSIVLSHHMPRN